jgi:tetratricopeptide (TPR) repeat protein
MAATTGQIAIHRTSRPPRAVGVLAAAIGIVLATYLTAGLRGGARSSPATDRPADASTVEAPAGASGGLAAQSLDQIDRSIKAWSANLAAEPKDFLSATNLASLYHGRGQLTASLDDHELAIRAARTALAIAPTHAPARALEAAIRYTLHDFAGAAAAAGSLYRDDPTQLGALATRADAELELGRVADARRDFGLLVAGAPGPAVDVRLARLAFLTGQPGEAVRLATAARDAARAPVTGSVPLDVGFYDFAAGEYSRLAGDTTGARAGYEAALAVRSTDLGALVGLARIDAFEGRTGDAIRGLRAAADIAPQPETLAILGDLLLATGDRAAADASFKTVRFIEQLGSIQGTVYDRQLLRFELDHAGATDAVLAAAGASAAARPDTTGHDLVAWALYRLGRFDPAAAEIGAARADGADDARLRYHDGAIQLALGHTAVAAALLSSAIEAGPALDPIERDEANRLLGR